MPRSTTSASKIVHVGTAEAKAVLQPLGKTVRVSSHAKDLIEDLRLAACAFGSAKDAADVERTWSVMQMRMLEVTEHVSELEKDSGAYRRDADMKF